MLGDPAQLPSPGRRDIFGTHLWRTFTILVVREIKRCRDPVLGNVLSKVRMGVCDEEVVDVLSNLLQPPDVDNIELDRTVVICSTRRECDDINDECIKKVVGEVSEYEALELTIMVILSGKLMGRGYRDTGRDFPINLN